MFVAQPRDERPSAVDLVYESDEVQVTLQPSVMDYVANRDKPTRREVIVDNDGEFHNRSITCADLYTKLEWTPELLTITLGNDELSNLQVSIKRKRNDGLREAMDKWRKSEEEYAEGRAVQQAEWDREIKNVSAERCMLHFPREEMDRAFAAADLHPVWVERAKWDQNRPLYPNGECLTTEGLVETISPYRPTQYYIDYAERLLYFNDGE